MLNGLNGLDLSVVMDVWYDGWIVRWMEGLICELFDGLIDGLDDVGISFSYHQPISYLISAGIIAMGGVKSVIRAGRA